MDGKILMLGYGPVGVATAERLVGHGRDLTIAQRKRPAVLPENLRYVSCDVLDSESVAAAVAGHAQVVLSISLPYEGRTWMRDWPIAMRNVLSACRTAGSRLVFVDDLYMYGPQNGPLSETTPLSNYGRKPRARSEVTRLWQASSAAGDVPVAALRPPDFYGPGVRMSHLGDVGFVRVAVGKPAMLIAPPDTLHDFAYVPDIGRAVHTLLDAPDSDFGQAWHMPCAPVRTPRDILQCGADAIGMPLKIRSLPLWLLPMIGTVSGPMREMAEMSFQWDRPYLVDASKWRSRFWSDVTPFEVGAAATVQSFIEQ